MNVEGPPAQQVQTPFARVMESVYCYGPLVIVGIIIGFVIGASMAFAFFHKKPNHHHGDVAPTPWCQAKITVSGDGVGADYYSITAAVEAAPNFSREKFCIHIKQGRYAENVFVGRKKTNLVFQGDGAGATTIVGNPNCMDQYCHSQSATLLVRGVGFMAVDLAIEKLNQTWNSTAVAVENWADQSVFLRCRLSGYRGALRASLYRQFYRDCQIEASNGIIRGRAMAVFQKCFVNILDAQPGGWFIVAQQARNSEAIFSGFVFHLSRISMSGGSNASSEAILAFPERPYARVVYLQTTLDVRARWSFDTSTPTTLFYGLYNNTGGGDGLYSSSLLKTLTRTDASEFSVRSLFGSWLPTDVPSDLDLV